MSHGFRSLTDAQLNTWSVGDLYELAGKCSEEPADPDVCDACAAYIIGQDKEQVLNEAKRQPSEAIRAQAEIEVLKAALTEAIIHIENLVEHLPTSKGYILGRVRQFKQIVRGIW